ncbi:MAG TPA: hypothetical protein VG672_12905 [Bryobacteraceae bacterium]|nr:hypothetical protein [Bryobacteraceae bacterium]
MDWVRTGTLNSRAVVLAANGAGGEQAARVVEIAVSRRPLAAVVSTGFCGALDPGWEIGSVFVASAVESSGGRYTARQPEAGRPYVSGVLASIDHIAGTAEEKRKLRAGGASAVEMEAAGVARAAERKGLEFYCVRAVSDLAGETFANDFNGVLRSDGHFDTIELLASAIRKPRVLVPELVRLHSRCQFAARTLGEFLANCRF